MSEASSGMIRTNGSVRVPKAAELVADDLRRRIIRGELPEGHALPNETALMEYYDVSRPTLREALRVLESESLISVKRGARGGARVQLPDPSVATRHAALLLQVSGTTLEDVFGARRVIEPAAARMLAERRPRGAVKRLREEHARELEAADDPEQFPVAAARFHELVVELAGNKTLALMSRMLQDIVSRHNRATFSRAAGRRDLAAEASTHHTELIELIAAGKADEAEESWRKHLDNAAAATLRTLGSRTVVDLFDT